MPKVFDKQLIRDRLIDYMMSTPDPNLLEFCSDFDNPTRETLYQWSNDAEIDKTFGFSDILKRMHDKQEMFLIRAKDVNPIMAIFRLKQPSFGYKDKQEIDTTVTTKVITVDMIGSIDD